MCKCGCVHFRQWPQSQQKSSAANCLPSKKSQPPDLWKRFSFFLEPKQLYLHWSSRVTTDLYFSIFPIHKKSKRGKTRCSFWIKSSWEENFGGPIGKTEGQNRTTHTTKFVVHFLLPYRIGLRFVPHCCIRQASRLLLELREREIQRASGQRALWVWDIFFLAQKRQQRDLT